MPEARQNSSKLPDIFESASSFSALVGTTVDVVSLFMALLCVPCEGVPSSPVEIRAGQLSFQPEALGAGQEATIDLKHFEKRPHVGVSGSCGPQCE
jgi:hypothetical protein